MLGLGYVFQVLEAVVLLVLVYVVYVVALGYLLAGVLLPDVAVHEDSAAVRSGPSEIAVLREREPDAVQNLKSLELL